MISNRPKFPSLRAYRDAAGLTLEQVGVQIGVDKATVCRWENGGSRVATWLIAKVERITGVERHDLRPDLYPPERERRAS
jgi:transcriptional regulator with XRE-family HTH domain